MRALILVPAVLALTASQQAGPLPSIVNGQVSVASAASPLAASFTGTAAGEPGVFWIGYAVPATPRDGVSCCTHPGPGDSGLVVSGCPLEDGRMTGTARTPAASQPPPPVRLEPPDRAYVMFRVVDREVERIRAFSEGCVLDAGGRAVRWLEGVQPAESVALLTSLISPAERRDAVSNGGMAALAMHAAPEAIDALIRLARQHATPGVRGHALFWLAQRAGQKAAGEIAARIDQDPDTEVKRRAVFALSQLPADQGVPLLIGVARTHANPVVRKQAFFWLGQSKDPRALEFFAEVLNR